jgi:hypothetical protein
MSADVESLYPNMDINLGLTLTKQFLAEINWESNEKRNFLIWAMHFVLTKGYISFKDKIYQQTNGAAMGSPMIPPYANIFMHMVERDIVNKFKNYYIILTYKRFIDDIFMITIRDHKSIQRIQHQLNNIHPNIKLTWTEPSSSVDFLDITIMLNHTKSTIETTIYQKPLNRYSYLPYHSFHTNSMKAGFIKGEAIRFARNCSMRKDFNKMIALFTLRLQRRGYPLLFIKNALKSIQYSKRAEYLKNKSSDTNTSAPYIFKILYNHYIPHHHLRKQLNKFSQQIQTDITDLPSTLKQKITICYKLPPTLHKKVLKARKSKGF